MGVACTGHMAYKRFTWGSLVLATCLDIGKLMHGGRWYRPHVLQKFYMGVAGTGHMAYKSFTFVFVLGVLFTSVRYCSNMFIIVLFPSRGVPR